jgi:hypothetical protein
MAESYKACPKCRTAAHLAAAHCQNCGHVYRTQFTQPPDQTQLHQVPPPPPPQYQPPQYQQPQYQYSAPTGDLIQVSPGMHPVAVAIVLAVFVGWWAGALVNRQYGKAAAVGGAALLCGLLVTVGIGLVLLPALYIAGIIDVVQIAQRLNRGEPVKQWQFF